MVIKMLIKAFVIVLVLFFFCSNGLFAHETERISYPSLYRFTSGSLRIQDADDKNKKIAIFNDDVHFEFRGVADFFSDELRIGFTKDDKFKYLELDGNVTMQKGTLQISSPNAYTDNLHSYIDFMDIVVISTNELVIHSMNIRYDFLTNTFFAF